MKKTLLIVIMLLVVGEAGGAWLMGRSIEQRVDDAVSQFGTMSPYLHVVDSQFHRGWFVSEQDVTMEAFGSAADPAPTSAAPFAFAPVRMTIHNVIHHGPVCGFTCVGLAEIHTHLLFSEPLHGYLTSIFGAAEPLSLRSRLSFFGGGSGTLSSPAISDVTLKDGSHVSSQGFSFDTAYGSNYDSYSLRGSLPQLTFKGADTKQFELTGMTVDVRSKRALRSLYSGNTSIEVGTLSLGGISPTGAVTLKGLQATDTSSVADGYLSMTAKMGVESVITTPLTLTGTHFDFTFRHLQAEALEQLSAASRAENQASKVSPMERLGKMTAALKAPAIALLSQQPEIRVDRISLATTAGGALLTGTLKMHDINALDFSEGASPLGLLQKLDADFDFTADDAFLTSLPGGANALAQLQPLVAQGLITHDAAKFHTVIGYHGGRATFNGKPFGPTSPAVPGPAGPKIK